MQKDGSLVELATVSPLVAALAGQSQGDERFYFPKEMLDQGNKNITIYLMRRIVSFQVTFIMVR